MPDKTERSNCRFAVQTTEGKSVLVLQLYQDTIPALKNAVLGFDMLAGLRPDAVSKIAETLNEHVLNVFFTTKG